MTSLVQQRLYASRKRKWNWSSQTTHHHLHHQLTHRRHERWRHRPSWRHPMYSSIPTADRPPCHLRHHLLRWRHHQWARFREFRVLRRRRVTRRPCTSTSAEPSTRHHLKRLPGTANGTWFKQYKFFKASIGSLKLKGAEAHVYTTKPWEQNIKSAWEVLTFKENARSYSHKTPAFGLTEGKRD